MLSAPLHPLHSSCPSIAPASVAPNDRSSSSPSSSSPSKKKSSTGTTTKRKRSDNPGDSANKNGPKKKKATRACVHCQKAHLTCDDSRPCQRCIKRGMASNCVEGHRKKAKYLLDDDELEALKREKPSGKSNSKPAHDPKLKRDQSQLEQPPSQQQQQPTSPELSGSATAPVPATEPFMSPASPMFPFTTATYTSPFDPNSYSFSPNFNSLSSSFGSEAANLEYSILSAILGSTSSPPESGSGGTPPPSSSTQEPSPTFSNPAWPGPPEYNQDTSNTSNGYDEQGMTSMSALSPASSLLPYPLPPRPPSANQMLQYVVPYSRTTPSSLQNRYTTQPGTANTSPGHSTASLPPASTSEDDSTTHGSALHRKCSLYDSVTKSYDYTEGYHFLMKFLVSRFEKNDILRVVRALAIFRPSLIALQMPLSEEDEVFVEKCFQRSLIELEKLVSFSGTPTVAWRRTGEICLVGDEFCLLTGWTKEELLVNGGQSTGFAGDVPQRKKFIYELFENQSVVEYWENFATHAFENTTQSVFSHCVLLKPSGAPVPCTFCFSIRRDLWDLPSLCVGQWLPLL